MDEELNWNTQPEKVIDRARISRTRRNMIGYELNMVVKSQVPHLCRFSQ